MIFNKTYLYLGGAWVYIPSDVFASPGLSYSGGINGNKETDRIAGAGSLSFSLKNNDGDYTPGSVTAHADWKKGTRVKVEFTKAGVTKVKFIGFVSGIKLTYAYNNNRANVTALSWMYYASQLPLNIPPLQTSKRADQVVSTIVALSTIQPESTSYQTGSNTFPYAFHDNTVKTTAYSEISKATFSEWGYTYEKLDGTLVFEAYNGRAATQKNITVISDVSGFLLQENGDFLLQENGDKILLEDYNTVTQSAEASTIGGIDIEYGERVINRVSAQVFPYKPGTDDVLVYTNETNQLIPAGQTVSFRVQFTEQQSKRPIAATLPTVKNYTLLHFDTPPDGVTGVRDTGESQILDSEVTSFNFFSGAALFTSTKKFGTASAGFDGLTDYIAGNSQEKFNFRSGDFTVDWWEYRLSATAGCAAISRDIAGGFSPFVLGYSDGATSRVYLTSNGSSWDIASAQSMGALTIGAWSHYAITKNGSTYRTFKDGVQQATWTSSATILASSAALSIFRYGAAYTEGYIDEFRMIKGYSAYDANFTPAVKQHNISGINWSLFASPLKSGSEITSSATLSISAGGAGIDVTVANSSGSNGYLNLDIYAPPLESLSPITYVAEDSSSIDDYGYSAENIDMRLLDNINFAKTISDALILQEKQPRTILNKISMVANKNDVNEALFFDCDIGDLVRVNESLSGYNELNHINAISWRAIPGDGNTIVFFDWILKEQ